MINYAVRDCTALAELYLIIYPEKANFNKTTTLVIASETPKTTSTIINNQQDSLLDISDEEVVIYIPQFNRTQLVLNHRFDPPFELAITTEQQEMDKINLTEQPEPPQQQHYLNRNGKKEKIETAKSS